MQLYEFGKLIGSGSFGQVFLCRHKRQDKYYVVKKLRIMELQQKQRQNIQFQLKLLQKLRHPNIVSYKDSFTDKDGNLCIVMVYCQAGDMYKRIVTTKEKGENFKQAQILDWISQTALAIHYLHNQKILHRDLKSQNLFLKKDQKGKDQKSKDDKGKQEKVQKVRLGDFGIAKVLDSAQDLTSTCIGTPYYMAPEIFKYKSYSYKCDIWSFGVIIYEMCNLRLPFQAQSYPTLAVKIMGGSYPSITPTYSKQLRDLISSMLSLKPNKRPTIIDIINKPFIKKRVQKYMMDMFSRSNSTNDNDDIYLDTLREQALSLGISLTNGQGSQEEMLKKYPSSKDLQRRWTRNILSRRGQEQQTQFKKQFHQKRKSLLERDSLSLEKNIRKKQDTSSSSTKALNLAYDLKDQKQAFIDHKKKSMMQKQVANKTLEQRRNLHDQVMKSQMNQEKYIQQENIRRFRMQQDYSMSDEPVQSEQSQIDEQIIQEQSEQDLHELTATKFDFEEQEQAPQNYNKSYYKILDQIRVLKHICETGIGTSKYLRAYNAVNNGCNKATILQILGAQFIGYWHLLDQIMFNDNILKTLSKQ